MTMESEVSPPIIRPTASPIYVFLRLLTLSILSVCFAICLAIFITPRTTLPNLTDQWEFRSAIEHPIWEFISVWHLFKFFLVPRSNCCQICLAITINGFALYNSVFRPHEKLSTQRKLASLIALDLFCFFCLWVSPFTGISFANLNFPVTTTLQFLMLVASYDESSNGKTVLKSERA
jgi:hypothetical protein